MILLIGTAFLDTNPTWIMNLASFLSHKDYTMREQLAHLCHE